MRKMRQNRLSARPIAGTTTVMRAVSAMVGVLAALVATSCSTPEEPETSCDPSREAEMHATAQWLMREMPDDWGWGWRAGIVISGLTAAYECTGETEYLDYAETWLQREIGIAYEPRHVNDLSPGPALIGPDV